MIFNHNKLFAQSNLGFNDFGLISIMYHRFNEDKYPSTNIQLEVFKEQIEIIEREKIRFVHPKEFKDSLYMDKNTRKVLLTIDDGLLSFYENAWPFLREKKIPFILFVSTREVGNFNYMNWDQIKELYDDPNVEIGNHSHSHEYLVDENLKVIKNDIKKSIEIFNKNLGKNSEFFSYPFGEYSSGFKKIIKELGFKFAFGQHSGVIDETKDLFELPRFPINEKYGETKRFKTILQTLPFPYKSIQPEEKYISNKNNPPKVNIQFYDNLKNLSNINCFSNEEDKWRNSKISFDSEYSLNINLDGKFVTERGRINCSLRETNGFYRWLGIQFVIKEK